MSMTLTRHGPTRSRRTVVGVTAAAALTAAALLPLAAPHPAGAADAAAQAAPVFGVNMSLYGKTDHLATDANTQALFGRWGTPMVRVPLRATYPDTGAALQDDDWLTAMKAVQKVGATPVLILRGPGGGRTTADIQATDTHLMNLVHQVFQNSTVYLEFGNEPDLAGVDAAHYTDAWNTVIPALKAQYPDADYQFVGPVLSRSDGTSADYIAGFAADAAPEPDALSWHEYLCDTTVKSDGSGGWNDPGSGDDTCTTHLANWQKHVTNIEDKVTSALGHSLDYFISEWNIDPSDQGAAYTSAHADDLATWTTAAVDELRSLSPAPSGAMIYTATDHGNFGLVTGSTTLTAQGTAFEDAMNGGSGGGPGGGSGGGGVTVGFEDGTADHWSGFYGNANPVVTSDVAYEGTHALRFNLSATGHSAVGTSTGLGAVRAGSTVTYHVYAAQSATTVTPFVRDKSYAATMAGSVVLPKGQWATVTWTVPSVSGVGAIGLDASSGTGTVTIDALTWPTS
ncbi:carbohydrate binding domain-containing protein [Streptomyces sp. 7R007]